MFKRFLLFALFALSLGGCAGQTLKNPGQDCATLGYVGGTPEYDKCVERGTQQRPEAPK